MHAALCRKQFLKNCDLDYQAAHLSWSTVDAFSDFQHRNTKLMPGDVIGVY